MITFLGTTAVSLYQHSDRLIHLYLTKVSSLFFLSLHFSKTKILEGCQCVSIHLSPPGSIFLCNP